MVGRGRRHVAAADPAIGLDALVPALGMQKALLEGRQLLSQGQLAVRAQGHGPQVFRLGPDTLGGIAYRTIERQHCRHSPAVWIDTLRLGVGERAGHGFMQLAPMQLRRRLQQEEPFELMTWLVPVIHSAQRLLQHHAGCRIDETALHVDNQRVQCRLRGRGGTHRQGGQKGLCQMHQGFCSGPVPNTDQSSSSCASYSPSSSAKRSATTLSAALSTDSASGSCTFAQ